MPRVDHNEHVDPKELQQRFAALTTAHVADACIRAGVAVRCGPSRLRAVEPGSRFVGRARPARHVGSVDVFLEALESARVGAWTITGEDLVLADDDGVLFIPADDADDLIARAEAIRDTERRQAAKVRAGVSLRSQLDFESFLARRAQDPALTFRDHLRSIGGAIEE